MSITRNPNDDCEDVEYIGGLLKRIGNFRADHFASDIEERKRFQKTIYLIQAFDIQLGYDFNWYLYGVYSPALADVGYKLAKKYESLHPREFADSEVEDRFREFETYIEPVATDTERLEISSSLHYLWVRNRDTNRDLLIEWLLNEKDLESDHGDCVSEWDRLAEYDVIRSS